MWRALSFVPGFRSGSWWKRLVAIVAYLLMLLLISAWGLPGIVLSFWVLLAVLILTNTANMRQRVRAFSSTKRGDIAKAWGAFAVIGMVVFIASFATYTPKQQTATPTASVQSASAVGTPPPGSAQSSDAPVTSASTAPAVSSAPTAAPTAKAPQPPPTPTPTPSKIEQLTGHVTAAWGTNWSAAISGLEELVQLDLENPGWKDKLYAARVNYAEQLIAQKKYQDAQTQIKRAAEIDPDRPEAHAAYALIPTPTPLPTPTPTKEQWVRANAQAIDIKRLFVDPDAFKGRPVRVTGRIRNANFESGGLFGKAHYFIDLIPDVPGEQFWSDGIAVYLYTEERGLPLTKDKRITVLGEVAGKRQVTRVLTGASNYVPGIDAYIIQ